MHRKKRDYFSNLAKIIFAACLFLSVGPAEARTISLEQRQKFTFSFENISISSFFEYIEKNSEYIFLYKKDLLDMSKKFSIRAENETIEGVLDKALAEFGVSYSINNRQITLYKAPVKQVSRQSPDVKTLSVRGVVVDTQDPPLPVEGATVMIKGTTTGESVDESGFFSINASKGEVLVFSCIGYKNVEMTVERSLANVSIALPEDVSFLDQAVVTGMTAQQRKHIASAVGVVNNQNFTNKPITHLSQALQGGTTGILVSQGSGEPGSDNATIKIRGVASLVGENPLVLVDGFEFDMNKLDPSTIESVTILKDAAAASIYGAKAGGGVILVTTKRGVAGTVKVNYNGYYGVQQALYNPGIAHTWEYMEYVNQAATNSGSAPVYQDAEIQMARDGSDLIHYPDTDWGDKLMKKFTNITEHNISVSGGNTTGRFALSAQYLKQDGIYKCIDNGFDRFTVRANTTVNMTKNIIVYVDTFIGRDNKKAPSSNIYQQISLMPRNIVAKYPKKEGSDVDYYGYYYGSTINALAELERGTLVTDTRDYVTINARPQWKITPDLTLKGQVGYRLSTGMTKRNGDPYVFFNYFTGEEMTSFNATKSVSYTTRSTFWSTGLNLDWVKEFKGHRINLLGGCYAEENGRTGWDKVTLVSYYGKMYYSYKDKYLFEAGIRADGSSLFSDNNKWGYFPSVAAGWNISKENFLKNVKQISSMKLRASFGVLGNNNISPYSYQSLINASSGVETRIGNPDLKWETVKITDFGLDLSIFDYAIDFAFDWYNKNVDDLIMTLPPSLSSALLDTPQNIGKARTRGVEFSLTYNKSFAEDIRLSVSLGYSYNKSKWRYVPGGRIVSGNTILVQGGPLFANNFYVADGLLTQEDIDNYVAIVGGYPDNGILSQSPGDIKYVDMNGDGVIDDGDKAPVGDREPHSVYYGNITFRIKNFDLDAQVTGQGRANGYYYGNFIQPLNSNFTGAVQKRQLDYWTPEHTDAKFPKPSAAGGANEYLSTYWMFNRAFTRVKYIQVGYSFPRFAKLIKASNVRVYVNVQNPFTFSDLKVTDPETCVSNSGAAVIWKYPIFRTYSAGLNVSF
ncbi:MAG: TonB-dependent receptor [Bacteroidales bacterium]|jgi:TonB-linked SusC/RagA family outer membrane protein|nr:TonB-dependent receptor [Bacteroidales bacterium]MDY2935463.1 TonB-dependent receptor [Candidatus Cryptobacteroides sp.]